MAAKLCNVCEKRRSIPSTNGQCEPCFEEGGWENTHNDAGHDHILESLEDVEYGKTIHKTKAEYLAWKKEMEEEIAGCWICFPKLNRAQKPLKATGTKKAQGFRRTQLNHKEMCTHAQTPKARRTCKNAFWAGVQVMMTTGKLTEDQAWEHCIKSLTTDQAANASLQAEPVKKTTKFTVAPKGHVGVGGKSLKAIKAGS